MLKFIPLNVSKCSMWDVEGVFWAIAESETGCGGLGGRNCQGSR